MCIRDSPNATLFEMKGKDHYATMTSYRDTIYQQVFNFLKNIELDPSQYGMVDSDTIEIDVVEGENY